MPSARTPRRLAGASCATPTPMAWRRGCRDTTIDVALLREAGRTLPAALAGEAGTRDVVMTPDTLALLERFYRDAPASAFYNRVLAEAVGRLVPEQQAGALRVLEVGAGTGGASGAVLGRAAGH